NAEGVQEGQAMTFHIPGFVVFLILASLWWEYCWKPARAQWKLDQWRRHQAKYPPTPEPFTPEWYEYIYKDDIPGLIARKYWGHLAGRISDAQGRRWLLELREELAKGVSDDRRHELLEQIKFCEQRLGKGAP